MLTCPHCHKVLTRCIPIQALLARGTHHLLCLCCGKPIIIFVKDTARIKNVEKGMHTEEKFNIYSNKGENK